MITFGKKLYKRRCFDMYYLSKRVLAVLGASVVMLLLFCLSIYGVYGAPAKNFKELINEKYTENQLKLVHVVFRHGERTPADTYPTDPYINVTFNPYGWGHLTNHGKSSLYEIGKWLRRRYNEFLGDTYSPDIIHAQSTGVTRTQMSMAVVLASLFPPKDTKLQWNKELNWQPVPFTSEPLDEDTLLLVRKSCPRYHEELDSVLNSGEVRLLMEENKELLENLTRLTGYNFKTPDDIQSLYSTLKAESDFGLELPSWIKEYYPQKLQSLTDKSYLFNVQNDELKKLKGGPFLKKTMSEWDQVANDEHNKKNKKIYVYAGHDATITNILSTFYVWQEQFPDYAIMALFELYKNVNTDQFAVKIFLKKYNEELQLLTIPGCDSLCPIDKLKIILQNVIPRDMKTECEAKDQGFVEPPPKGP